MAGQVELRYKLADRTKRALVSRIAVSSVLDALTLEETRGMISFRCTVAGVKNPFTDGAVETIYQLSKGVPREAIKLCALGVQYATMNETARIDRDLIEAAREDLVQVAEEETMAAAGTMSASRELS
jgi:type II secretory pathway predicted ATPase ExeA